MLRMSLTTRGGTRAGIGSTLALALALAGGSAAATIALTEPALAQQAPARADYKPSREFGRIYQPLADIANSANGDFAAARAQLPAVVAAIENADDRFLAGSLHFSLGLKLTDKAMQRQGMEL